MVPIDYSCYNFPPMNTGIKELIAFDPKGFRMLLIGWAVLLLLGIGVGCFIGRDSMPAKPHAQNHTNDSPHPADNAGDVGRAGLRSGEPSLEFVGGENVLSRSSRIFRQISGKRCRWRSGHNRFVEIVKPNFLPCLIEGSRAGFFEVFELVHAVR